MLKSQMFIQLYNYILIKYSPNKEKNRVLIWKIKIKNITLYSIEKKKIIKNICLSLLAVNLGGANGFGNGDVFISKY